MASQNEQTILDFIKEDEILSDEEYDKRREEIAIKLKIKIANVDYLSILLTETFHYNSATFEKYLKRYQEM